MREGCRFSGHRPVCSAGPSIARSRSRAKQNVLEALSGLADDRFWEQLRAGVGAPPVEFPVVGDQLARVQNLFSDSLTQVLLEVGYQPPPPAWVLVRDARGAVEDALLWGAEHDQGSMQRHLQNLITALTALELDTQAVSYLRGLLRSCGHVAIAGAVAVGATLGTGTVSAVGEEFVYPAAVSVIDHALDAWMDEPNDPEGAEESEPNTTSSPEPTDPELAELQRQLLREQVRLTRAQAEQIESHIREARDRERRPPGDTGKRPARRGID